MDARSKRREATRRQLEQQLKERQAREARRKRTTLIASIVGTVVVIAVVVVLVVVLAGGNDKSPQAGSSDAVSPTATASSAASSAAAPLAAPAACTAPTGKATAAFDGVSVANAINLKKDPKVTSKSTAVPAGLACDDLVVGKGAPATASSTVSVQYAGVLYKTGVTFDSSWARGQSASFSLAQVVPGFTQGIGGTGKVAPMRVGGRRIMILPAALGYGSTAQQGIPANSPLVFVVDLLKV